MATRCPFRLTKKRNTRSPSWTRRRVIPSRSNGSKAAKCTSHAPERVLVARRAATGPATPNRLPEPEAIRVTQGAASAPPLLVRETTVRTGFHTDHAPEDGFTLIELLIGMAMG